MAVRGILEDVLISLASISISTYVQVGVCEVGIKSNGIHSDTKERHCSDANANKGEGRKWELGRYSKGLWKSDGCCRINLQHKAQRLTTKQGQVINLPSLSSSSSGGASR